MTAQQSLQCCYPDSACLGEEMQLHCATGNAGKQRLGFRVKCLLRSDIFRAYCVVILMLKHLQHVWLGDTGDEKGEQRRQSHHAVHTPALFTFSHMRHRALGVVNILKAALCALHSYH